MSFCDHSDCTSRNTSVTADRLSKLHLITRTDFHFRIGNHRATRAVDKIDADFFQGFCELDRLRQIPPAFNQSVAEILTNSGNPFGQTSRTAAAILSGNRMRFSSDPPN